MRKILVPATALAATLALGLAVPAATEASNVSVKMGAAGGASNSATKPVANNQRHYCFVTEIVGSRIPKKICQTKAEWKAEGVEVPVK